MKISNMINVYNKIDVSKSKFNFNQNRIFVSALTGEGIDNLKDRIKKEIIASFNYFIEPFLASYPQTSFYVFIYNLNIIRCSKYIFNFFITRYPPR